MDYNYYDQKPKKNKSFAKGVLTGALSVSVVFAIIVCVFFKVIYHDTSDLLSKETKQKLGMVYSVIQN